MLVIHGSGGHFVMVAEQAAIRSAVQKQILENAGIPTAQNEEDSKS